MTPLKVIAKIQARSKRVGVCAIRPRNAVGCGCPVPTNGKIKYGPCLDACPIPSESDYIRRTRHRNGDRATAARQGQHARCAVISELR